MAKTIKSRGEASKVMLTKKICFCGMEWLVARKTTVELKQSVGAVQNCFSQYPPCLAARSQMTIFRDQGVVI